MPHYFFDLTDSKIIHDFKGKQLANVQAARQHAVGIVLELVTTKSALLQEPLSSWSISVKDGKFHRLFAVPVVDQSGTA
jgi:hypothetical protein